MANLVKTKKTNLEPDEVIVKSVQYFSNESWRTKSQSEKLATFEGRPPIPWFLLILTFFAFFFFIIPGLILYFLVIRKMYRFQNLVVTAKPIENGTEVHINFPLYTEKLVNNFLKTLPAHDSEVESIELPDQAVQPA